MLAKGGKLAIVTNRNNALDAYTWRNLQAQGLPVTKDNTCLMGRLAEDKSAINGTTIINDKDRRRQLVSSGQAQCFGVTDNSDWANPHEIVMEVGDNIEDFTGITQEEAEIETLAPQFPARLILLPNPMYGSW